MVYFLVALATFAAGALLMGVVFLLLRKQVATSVGAQTGEYITQIEAAEKEVGDLLQSSSEYAARGQLNSLNTILNNLKSELDKERAALQGLEPKLDTAQKNVEEKETQQQELKSAKEENEIKLRQLMESFDEISGESVALEQQLANSLKNLDTLMSEVQLTDEQRAILQELSNTLTNSGSVLRELIMEYESINERLTMLKGQLSDLEDEYTKLVEKQLGE